jgi:uncharacterized protein (DUF58 family)
MTPDLKSRKLTDLLDAKFLARLDGLDVMSRKIVQGKVQGERRSKRRGEGVEFADHRPYVAGDDLRFVDWNIYARLDQFFVKLFLEEQDLSVHILADASASVSAGEPAKDLAIRKLAAALGYVSVVNNNRLTISRFADGLTGQLANMRGRSYLPQMADFLLGAVSEGPSRFDRACRQAADSRTGKGIMIVLSDFLFKEGYQSGLRRLISRQYDLYAIQVLSPQELNPDFSGDLKLVDLEDGDTAEVTVSAALLKFYKRTLGAYCNELKEFCAGRGAQYMLASSGDSAEAMVLHALRRNGLLR